MTLQIVRKNDRYYIRRKWLLWSRFLYTSEYTGGSKAWGHPFLIINGIWTRATFDSYEQAALFLERLIEKYIAVVVEKISPLVVEDERKV
jgi:hypothetical protein